MSWAAELNDNDIVVRVIVGTADWATDNLGGRWVPCDKDSDDYPGAGWSYIGGVFVPPEPAWPIPPDMP